MPNIIIREIDETVPSAAVSEITDIAFIPGVADTNNNCYIVATADGAPTNGTTLGTKAELKDGAYLFDYNTKTTSGNPQYFVNTALKKVWVCTDESKKTWVAQTTYVAPHPENTPVVCYSLADFEENFGSLPYKFTEDQYYPTFAETAKVNGTKIYNDGDFEKSYIIARELIGRGLPVMYANIVNRGTDGKKATPTVSDIYAGIEKYYTKPTFTDGGDEPANYDLYLGDRGTYSVKYLTSGAYPTFELLGGASTAETTETLKCGANGVATLLKAPAVSVSAVKKGNSPLSTTDYTFNKEAGTITIKTYDNMATYSATYAYATPDFTNLTKNMVATAKDRGDAVAIIDYANAPTRALYGNGSVYAAVNSTPIADGEYAAMFTPWAMYETIRERNDMTATTQLLPPSFGYLNALAQSIKTNDNWLAIAGVARGYVPQILALNTVNALSNTIADLYQPKTGVSINAITNVRPYGLTIYANRTLKNNGTFGKLSALSSLNIRNMVSDIKKTVYATAKRLVFEQNTDVLWVNFKAGITGILDKMITGNGIESYKITREQSGTKEKVKATIKIVPIRPVEDFEIDIVLTDSTVEVTTA